MPKAYMIIDGQFGSTGKGLLAGYLAMQRKPDVVVCNFGPNAGHTCIVGLPALIGIKPVTIMTQQLPTGGVVLSQKGESVKMLIGPGAVIDVDILLAEMENFEILPEEVFIHEHAAVVSKEDKEAEAVGTKHIASTMKGTGAAIQRKISRASESVVARSNKRLAPMVVTKEEYNRVLHNAHTVQIESAQGFDLSLNHGTRYPYVTSRDITPEAVLNDAAMPMRWLDEVCVTLRTFPIRVGNVVENGKTMGVSGPCYSDQTELTWEDMAKRGVTVPERTTVTQRVRRIFTWSDRQFSRMIEAFAPCNIFLNFCNYMSPEELNHLKSRMRVAARSHKDVKLMWTGHGPHVNDIECLNKGETDA